MTTQTHSYNKAAAWADRELIKYGPFRLSYFNYEGTMMVCLPLCKHVTLERLYEMAKHYNYSIELPEVARRNVLK